jgi:hypothetical protein
MALQCPECSTSSLGITHSLELPPDARSDEITLQIIECSNCKFQGIGVYEESRRGSLDSDHFHHTGYYVAQEEFDQLRKAISDCPNPKNLNCSCASHKKLGVKNEHGRWIGIEEITPLNEFVIKR